jgi:hypothetical protein
VLAVSLIVLIAGGASPAAAQDCVALGGVEAGAPGTGTCTISAPVNVPGGTFNIDRTLVIQAAVDASNDVPAGLTINVCVAPAPVFPSCDILIEAGGSIDASDDAADNEGGDSPKNITLRASRDLIMAGGTFITSENTTGGGGGDNLIDIAVGRNVTLGNNAGAAPGSTISASNLSNGGAALAGDIRIVAGPPPQSSVGRVTIHEFSVVKVNTENATKAGQIDIIAGNAIVVNGEVLAEAAPGDNTGEGGVINLISCTVLVGDTGKVSSKGNDAGADLVHLEGCEITIDGLVQSTGPGHRTVGTGDKLCQAAPRGAAHVQDNRPGFTNWTACVEIWAGTVIRIRESGEVHADVGQAGGVGGGGWIDLFSNGLIEILGDTASPFAVHANMPGNLSGAQGGLVTIISRTGNVVFTGLAVQASATAGNTAKGGQIDMQAGQNITGNAPTPTLEAQGDITGGVVGTGGMLELRAFNGAIDWQNGVGNVQPIATGTISLTACLAPIVTTGTNFFGEVPTTATGVCGGNPVLAAYVILPICTPTSCQERPGEPPPGDCDKSSVTSVMDPATGRFPNNKGFDATIAVHDGAVIQSFVDAATDSNADGYILLLVIAKDGGALGGHTTQSVVISKSFDLPFGLIGCSVTMHALSGPAGSVTNGASAPLPPGGTGNIFVMDLHGADSAVAGWQVRGNGRYLRNVNAIENTIGIDVQGNNNTVHNGTAEDNLGTGIKVEGIGNTVTGAKAFGNAGHGIEVSGTGNTVEKTDVGDRNKGNTGDGIHVTGTGNAVNENDAFANSGNGVFVSGNSNQVKKNNAGERNKGNSESGFSINGNSNNLTENDAFANNANGFSIVGDSNVLKNNRAGDAGKGNLQDGFNVRGSTNVLDGNRANGNLGDGFDFALAGGNNNVLKSNKSNEGANGGNKENAGCEYSFVNGTSTDAGGNKRNNQNFPGVAGKYAAGCFE